MPGISDLLDSDLEENNFIDENSIISSASDETDALSAGHNGTAKKAKKRHRVTMPKTKSRIAKTSPAPTTKRAPKKALTAKRKALEEAVDVDVIADGQHVGTSVDDTGMQVDGIPRAKQKPAAKKKASKMKTSANQVEAEGMETEPTPITARSSHARDANTKEPKVIRLQKQASVTKAPQDIVVGTQSELVDVAVEMDEMDEITTQQPPIKKPRTDSRTRLEPAYRRRAGSASDTERGDPNLRRKLGDVTRKFENIDMKYKNLKEVGITEASTNVEKLRKQCEATTEASNNLIQSLKKELAQQAPLVQDARKLKKDLQTRDDELAQLRISQAELVASLGTAQNEIKALQAKLTAARTASVEPVPLKTPGSAIKMSRPTAVSNAEANQAALMVQMKLDLYSDLTGLIVRSVKRSADGDTYDCIQTGRNGTLHFKLFIDQEDAKTASLEETEFLYTPLLDENRDRDMMELMPQYLTEDITFARQNAAKFYQRVVDTLTRRAYEA